MESDPELVPVVSPYNALIITNADKTYVIFFNRTKPSFLFYSLISQ